MIKIKNQKLKLHNLYFFLSSLLIFSSSSFIAFSNEPVDWYQYHGPTRDRISTESGWNTNWSEHDPEIIWKTNVGKGFSSISVVDNRAYTMGNENDQDTVWCFDIDTGDVIWKHTYPCELYANMHEGGPGCTPTVDGDRVYTVSKQGQMFCLNAKTGDVEWSKDLVNEFGVEMPTWRFSVSPLVEGDALILDIGKTVALNKIDGSLLWKTENFTSAYSSTIAFTHNDKRYIATFPAYGLVILDAANGDEIAKYQWDTKYGINAATPIVNGNLIFISSGYGEGGSLLEFNNETLREVWHNRLMRNQMNASVLWNGHLYGFDESNLKCISLTNGEETWRERGLGKGSLMLADGKLIILGERGDLVIAEATSESYKPVSSKKVLSGRCWTIPVLSHGKIFCRNAEGDLVCLDVSKN